MAAAASPGGKGKGKAKSPKRMWGKRFKVRVGDWFGRRFSLRGGARDSQGKPYM